MFSLAGAKPAKLIPAALRKRVEAVVFMRAPLKIRALPGVGEVRLRSSVGIWLESPSSNRE